MRAEKIIIGVGFLLLVLVLVVVNIVAFGIIEGKILEAVDAKCASSVQGVNNVQGQSVGIVQTGNERVAETVIRLNDDGEWEDD